MLPRPFYAGIFFLTFSLLSYELSLIRLFSIARWYHFAFLVVSIAMLGLGAAGSFATLRPGRAKHAIPERFAIFAAFCGVSILLAYLISNHIPFDQQRMAYDRWQLVYVAMYYIVLAVPFFFAGLILARAYCQFAACIGALYLADLSGAALGAIVVLRAGMFACGLGGIFLAALSAFAAALMFSRKPAFLIAGMAGILSVLLLSLYPPQFMALRISEYKALRQLLMATGAEHLATHWTPAARIDFVKSPLVHFAPGLPLRAQQKLPEQIGVVLDGGSLNALTRFAHAAHAAEFSAELPNALPYHLDNIDSVMVIEPGGGLSFLVGLQHGAMHFEGAGMRTIIARLAAKEFPQFTGGLFARPEIHLHTMSARAFLARTPMRFDLIELPITDGFAVAGTGISGPVENYVLTIEAFRQYLAHLRSSGWLSISCYLLPPLRQELRLVSLAVAALEAAGVRHPEAHLLSFRTLETFHLLLSPEPVPQESIESFKNFCRVRKFDLVHFPGILPEDANRFHRFPRPVVYESVQALLAPESRRQFYENYTFDVRATSDDRPFFSHFFRYDQIGAELRAFHGQWTAFLEGGYLIPVLFAQAFLLSAVFIVLPHFLSRHKLPAGPAMQRPLMYFFCIGLGFMSIEIVLLQKFILYLDHPVYASSAVIAGLLVFTGIGSSLSGKITRQRHWRLQRHTLLLAGLFLMVAFILPGVLQRCMGYPLSVRYLLALAALFLPGLCMGVMFPAGIRALAHARADLIPLAYAANACASVIAASLAVLIALEFGFTAVLLFACGVYLLAGITKLY